MTEGLGSGAPHASSFPHVFRPLRVAGFEVANRIVIPSHTNRLSRDRELRYLSQLACGGPGLMGIHSIPPSTGEFHVGPGSYDPRWGTEFDTVAPDPASAEGIAFHDEAIPAMRKRAQVIHDEGVKVYAQIYNVGAGSHRDRLRPAIAPSPVPDPYDGVVPHALTEDEIHRVIVAFAHAVRRAKEAGVDAAELHAAHGYLLNQFFSPKFNRRQDRWGAGSLEDRTRVVMEILAMARDLVPDYPVGIRVGLEGDAARGGLSLPDLLGICALLAPYLAFINVSGGSYSGLGDGLEQAYIAPWYGRPLTNVPIAAAVKRAVPGVPVFVAHKIADLSDAERILAEGAADMAGMVRAMIADPASLRKAAAGRADEIRRCIGLNECRSADPGRPLMCAVNPDAGREDEMEIRAALRKRTVLVVGAGPAGMEAARSAALRGHHVRLVDRAGELGGMMRILAMDPSRGELRTLPDHMAGELDRAGVDVRLAEDATVESILAQAPEVVILATGAVPYIPAVPGIDSARVVTAAQVLTGKATVGARVLVVGETDDHIAAGSISDLLAERGASVEVISEHVDFAAAVEHTTRYILVKRLLSKGVQISTMMRLVAVTESGAEVINIFSRERRRMDVDTVVIAAGGRADDRLATALRGRVPELHLVGDCLAPRRIVHATLEGARVGRAV